MLGLLQWLERIAEPKRGQSKYPFEAIIYSGPFSDPSAFGAESADHSMKDNDAYQTAISMLLSGSLDLAIKKLEILSKSGNGHADSVLGNIYEFGKGHIVKDQQKALRLYESSIESSGSVQAWLGLARICLYGDSKNIEYERARECLLEVARKTNYPQAWLHLGYIYLNGLGVKKNIIIAKRNFQKSILYGSILGYTGLGRVALAEGKIFRSIFLRLIAVIKAVGKILHGKASDDSLNPW